MGRKNIGSQEWYKNKQLIMATKSIPPHAPKKAREKEEENIS